MKRHLLPLLQRKRSDFDGSARAAEAPRRASTMTTELNGYDWLKKIKHARVVRV